MSTSISIKLKRASKVYHEGEIIAGVVVVESGAETRHEGLTLVLEGTVSLQFSNKTTGLLDAFSNNLKAITLINLCVELCPAGKLPAGITEIPFEVPLVPRTPPASAPAPLLESYHGVFVNVMYELKATMKRSFLNKPVNANCHFFVQYRHQEPPPLKPVRCEISPATIRAGSGSAGPAPAPKHQMPSFHIYAEIDSTVCALDRPITGLLRVDECSVPIKSIELQLVRVETCGSAEGYSRDGTTIDDSFNLTTEIQNIQVGAGDVARSRPLPLYMVLPRLFTCPTTTTHHFKIEFELNIAVIFEDDYLVTENFPILLLRSR